MKEKIPAIKAPPFPMDCGCECHAPNSASHSLRDSISRNLQVFFVAFSFAMAFSAQGSDIFATFSIIFSAIMLEAVPFMLMGALLGGFIEIFLSRERLIDLLPKRSVNAIVLAAMLGLIFPVCECAIVPVVKKLSDKGMPLGASVAFLLGGPIVNPLVFASTLVAYSFSWETALVRSFTGFVIAVGVGILIDRSLSGKEALLDSAPPSPHGCGCNHENASLLNFRGKMLAAISHGASDFYGICRFLIIGAFIAAALQTLVPRQIFIPVMTRPVTAIIAMMLLAVTLNLCSEADAFVSASLQPMGVPFSAQLAFMVLGPMLDIKLILMYLTVFSKKMIITLSCMVIAAVTSAMFLLETVKWLCP